MIALLLALVVVAPQPPRPTKDEGLEAWKRETLCWGDYCGPRVVNLGDWDPRPADKDWPN